MCQQKKFNTMKNKKLTITIGIPAYQSAHNIKNLLRAILKQKEKLIVIEKILIYADGCTDKTVEEAKSLKNSRIKVFSEKVNRGYAYSFQYLINRSTSDVFVGLNDDIKIKSRSAIEALVSPIMEDKKIGLVGGNVVSLLPKTFIGRCVYTSYLSFLPIRLKWKNGKSKFTCDGKILALKKSFYKSLKLLSASTATVDIYLYFENLRQRRKYAFAKDAIVYYRLPETIGDFRNQEERTRKGFEIMRGHFGKIVEAEHWIPRKLYWLSSLKVFLKYPLESLFFKIFINSFYILQRNKEFKKWRLAKSTKHLLSYLLT